MWIPQSPLHFPSQVFVLCELTEIPSNKPLMPHMRKLCSFCLSLSRSLGLPLISLSWKKTHTKKKNTPLSLTSCLLASVSTVKPFPSFHLSFSKASACGGTEMTRCPSVPSLHLSSMYFYFFYGLMMDFSRFCCLDSIDKNLAVTLPVNSCSAEITHQITLFSHLFYLFRFFFVCLFFFKQKGHVKSPLT